MAPSRDKPLSTNQCSHGECIVHETPLILEETHHHLSHKHPTVASLTSMDQVLKKHSYCLLFWMPLRYFYRDFYRIYHVRHHLETTKLKDPFAQSEQNYHFL